MLKNRNPAVHRRELPLLKQVALSLSLASLTCCSALANATITGAYWDYGTGSIACYDQYDSATPDVLTIFGTQTGPTGGMSGWVTTDTSGDPNLTLNHSINNDSGQNWTEYVVDVFMSVDFSFSGITVSNPTGWVGGVSFAHQQLSPTSWEGEIVYSENGGPPVNTIAGDPNNVLDFSYTVSFSGNTFYSITEQVTAVPEPSAFSLLIGGGLLLGAWTTASRRRSTKTLAKG